MPESQDPLRSLFQQAAEAGRRQAVPAPPSDITARGRRAHRRHVALVVAAGLALAGGGIAAATLLPGEPDPAVPATTPSPGRSSAVPPTRPPSSGATTAPATSPPPQAPTTMPPSRTAGSPESSTTAPPSSPGR
ncbi:hypothetical protein ABZ569_19845 [Streptomyces albus]|uniref:hypothetical protein n=1 Tax=Streptomyces albus TaxID=1888 RepID=UPI0033DDF3D8